MEMGNLYNTVFGADSVASRRAQIAEWRESRRAGRGTGRGSAASSGSVSSVDSQNSFDSYVERMVSLRYRDGYGSYSSSLNPYSNENNSLSALYNYGNSYRSPWASYGSGDSFERCIGLIADALEEKGGTSDGEKNYFTTYDAAGRKTKLQKDTVLGTGKTYGTGQESQTTSSYSSRNPLSRILNFFMNRSR